MPLLSRYEFAARERHPILSRPEGTPMKRVALAVLLLLVAGEASAISRYDVDNMRCSKVKAILKA